MGDKFKAWLQKHVMPIAGKLGTNRWLMSIRDGITMAMPLIIVGSLFMIIASFPVPGWPEFLASVSVHGTSLADIFNKIVNGSFGILGLIACFGIANSFASQAGTDGVSAGIIAAASYFIVTPSIFSNAKVPAEGMPYGYLGSKGLFVGILIGLLGGWIFQWFINHNIQIKLPDTVPPAVGKSFSALIPGFVIMTLAGLTYGVCAWTGVGNIHDVLFKVLRVPLSLLGDTLGGTLVAVFVNSALWFVGIHGMNVINGVMQPIWLLNSDANRRLYEAGHLDLAHGGHVICQSFIDNFVFMGGGGATLGLVLALGVIVWRKKASTTFKSLAPITIIPGIFNINEPTMFGLPIVMNLTMVIPFIIVPMVNAIISYVVMRLGWVPLPNGAVIPWTMPPILSGFLATNSWQACILQAINIVIDIAIYAPFLMIYNNELKAKEVVDAK